MNKDQIHNQQIDSLEIEYVDKLSLSKTVELLAEICSAKADHIESNWGPPLNADNTLADGWNELAGVLLNCQNVIRTRSDRLQGLII